MKYHVRKDIVLEKVSGIYVLVALRSAWKECPFAMQTIPVYAEIWEKLNKNESSEKIIDYLMNIRGFSEERASKIYAKFIESAAKYRYLVIEDQVNDK